MACSGDAFVMRVALLLLKAMVTIMPKKRIVHLYHCVVVGSLGWVVWVCKRELHSSILGMRGPVCAGARRAFLVLQDGVQRQAGAGSQGAAARPVVHHHGEQGMEEGPRHVCTSGEQAYGGWKRNGMTG